LELELAGTGCAWGISGAAAVSGFPAEDGYAGGAGGGDPPTCIVLLTPTQAELRWGTRFVFNSVGAAWTGATGFRRYRRWRAELQLGLGAGYFGADRSCGREWKHGCCSGARLADFGGLRTREA